MAVLFVADTSSGPKAINPTPVLPEGFGQYVSDNAPIEADPGAVITISVSIRNDGGNSELGAQLSVDGVPQGTPTRLSQLTGETAIHTLPSFTMPAVPVSIEIVCGHWTGTEF